MKPMPGLTGAGPRRVTLADMTSPGGTLAGGPGPGGRRRQSRRARKKGADGRPGRTKIGGPRGFREVIPVGMLRAKHPAYQGADVHVSGIITAIVIGLVIGVLGRLVVPGKQNIPIWLTILIGIVAAIIGTFIASALGVNDTNGIDWIELLIQVVLAAIGVAGVAGIYGRRA
jgi:uncharacterized membrane protein YeaQ/YmgE (transglycosylase-associated protein family)